MAFPDGFAWGAATSAYQIEGAAHEDGRAESVWDSYCRRPGSILGGHTGDIACDHYHRFEEDVRLMRDLGLRAYRFSIAWPRVLPEGTGALNERGLAFYDRLVDALLSAGIEPYATLFHWDYPEALFRRGGWLKRESASWFAEYAGVVTARLGDRVRNWITLNEPQVFLKFGHADGTNAPGLMLPVRDQLLAAHHVLLAHGLGTQAIRARAKAPARVGWAMVCIAGIPASESGEDVSAARSLTCSVTSRDLWNNVWFSDPILLGRYPEDALRVYAEDVPRFDSADLDIIRQPLDFLGLNIYEGRPVRAGADGSPEPVQRPPGHPMTAIGWAVEPESLYWGPRFMHERYRVPLCVTENGMSNIDWVSTDGAVHDPQRIDFTRRYLLALRRACEQGVDVRGYFHWSLMDNFEWAFGYRERFGLIHVDYATQKRTPKDSAAWYRSVIETNGQCL
jgi:beta-glucosidase